MPEEDGCALIIPAYNEAGSIADVVAACRPYGRVIVVDDASSDGTGDLATEAGAIVVRHSENRGYDGALDSGFAEAARQGCRWAVTLDADGQHEPERVLAFQKRLRDGAVLVVGVRPQVARWSEFVFSLTIRTLYGIHDPLCGMKGYDLSFYRQIGYFDRLRSIGTQLLVTALRRRCRVEEIPVKIFPRTCGSARFGQSLRADARIVRALILVLIKAR